MDPVIVASAVTAVLGSLGTIMALCLREQRRRHQLSEQARRDHVRDLPPGSRIVDFGDRGMVIDIGAQPDAGREEQADGQR